MGRPGVNPDRLSVKQIEPPSRQERQGRQVVAVYFVARPDALERDSIHTPRPSKHLGVPPELPDDTYIFLASWQLAVFIPLRNDE
jgi:hypothetical protein